MPTEYESRRMLNCLREVMSQVRMMQINLAGVGMSVLSVVQELEEELEELSESESYVTDHHPSVGSQLDTDNLPAHPEVDTPSWEMEEIRQAERDAIPLKGPLGVPGPSQRSLDELPTLVGGKIVSVCMKCGTAPCSCQCSDDGGNP